MRRLLRTFAWGVAGLLAVLVILAVALWSVDRGWQRERVRSLAERGLESALDVPVHVGSLEGILHEGFVLRDVRVGDLHAASLEARLDLSRLWSERVVRIEALTLEGLRLLVLRDAAGSWRVAGLPERRPEPGGGPGLPPVAVELELLEVRDAEVALEWSGAAGTSRVAARASLRLRGLRWPDEPRGPWPDEAALEARLLPSRVHGRDVHGGVLTARLEGGRLKLAPSSLQSAFGRLEGEGEAELQRDDRGLRVVRATGRARVAGLDLAGLTGDGELASDLNGTLELDADPAGASLAAGAGLHARATLTASTLAGSTLAGAELVGSYATATAAWRVERLEVHGALGRLEAVGRGVGDSLEDVELRLADLDLAGLPAPWRPRPGVAGRLDGEARLGGPWRDPRGRLTLAGRALQSGEIGPADVTLSGEALGDRRFRLESLQVTTRELAVTSTAPALVGFHARGVDLEGVRLAWEGGALGLDGRIRGDRLEPLRIDVTTLDVAAAAALAGLEVEMGGRATAQLVAHGPLRRPRVDGAALWEEARIGAARAERVLIEAHAEGPTVFVLTHLVDAGRERLRIEAELPYATLRAEPRRLLERPDTVLRLRAERLDLAWLARTLPRELARASGMVDADATLRGGTPEPELEGELRLADAHLEVPALGLVFGPAQGVARLGPGRIEIASLRVASEPGQATLEGELGWSAAGPGALRLVSRFERFAISRTPTLRADLDGTLQVEGRFPRLRVDGDLSLADARIGLPEESDPLVKEVRVLGLPDTDEPARIVEQAAPSPGWLDESAAEVVLRVPRNTWVQGRGVDVEIEGELRVRKAPGREATFFGTLQVVRGRYRFQGRSFQVERGVATFTGTRELDPELDFVAVHRVRDVTLRARVAGRASAPSLALESEPPLDSTDLLSYLAFGRPAHELGTGESMRLEAAATQLAGQIVAGGVVSALAPALPLDLFDVALADGGTSATVEVGKYLRENIFVRYGRGFGTEQTDRVRIEWRFLPRWSVESEIGSSGSAGADVIWSFDY